MSTPEFPLRDVPVAEPGPPTATASDALIIGPSQSGKTQFVLSLLQACHTQLANEPVLRVVPENENMTKLLSRAAELMFSRKRLLGTTQPEKYAFRIRAYKGMRRGNPYGGMGELGVVFEDGPGGQLFPNESTDPEVVRQITTWQTQLAEKAKTARFLILCVDASSRSDVLFHRLPELLQRMQVEMEVVEDDEKSKVGELKQRILRNPTRQPRRSTERRLNFDRVLLLLNKVDILASRVVELGLGDGNVRHIAENMEPVENARHYFSPQFLTSIRAAMKPGARLAVALCSAGGFFEVNDQENRPFLNAAGQVNAPEDLDGIDLLRRWRPLGVREAMHFMAFGGESDSVRVLEDQDLLVNPGESAYTITTTS
jgi:hypothetical protein